MGVPSRLAIPALPGSADGQAFRWNATTGRIEPVAGVTIDADGNVVAESVSVGTTLTVAGQDIADLIYPAAYGVRWNQSTDVVTPGIIVGNQFVEWDYTQMPVHDKCGLRCVRHHTDGSIVYYLHPDDSTFRADGYTAANLDGTDGQVMSEFAPFHCLRKNDGNYRYLLVGERQFMLTLSDSSVVASKVHDWFFEDGEVVEHQYASAFEGVLYDVSAASYVDGTGAALYASGDYIHSIYGYIPITNISRSELRAGASATGDYHGGNSVFERDALLLLFVTKYKGFNGQTLLPGYTEGGSWNFAKVCKTGITAQLGNHDGSVTWADAPPALRCSHDFSATPTINLSMAFMGVENWFGGLWKWLLGINVNFVGSPLTEANVYVSNDPSNWADDTVTNYIDTVVDLPLVSDYQTDIHDGLMIPSADSGGSSNTYLCDYYWASSSAGWRAPLSGGVLYYGAVAGPVTLNVANAASSLAADWCGRTAASNKRST